MRRALLVLGLAWLGSPGAGQAGAGQAGAGQQVEALLQEQQRAVLSGDGAQVLATSRALAATASGLLGDIAAAAGRLPEAETWYDESLELRPSEATRLSLVAAEARGGNAAKADMTAEATVRAEGESARLRMELALAMHGNGTVNGTIRQLQRAVELEPGSAAAHLALGSAFWELNYFQYNSDSLREFGEAVRLEPESALANFDIGSVLSQYERYDEARGYLEKAAALEPGSPDAVLQLGMNFWAQGKTEESRERLRQAVDLTGTEVERNNYQVRRALAVLTRIDADSGRDELAAKDAAADEELRRQVGVSGQVGAISESVGSVTAVPRPGGATEPPTGRPATADLERKLRELLAQSLNDAGTALARERDYTGALPMFREAAAADRSTPGVERNLGVAAFHVGSWSEAVEALDLAVTAQPGDTLAARYLQEARGHLGANGTSP